MNRIETHMHLWKEPYRMVHRRTSHAGYRPTFHAHQGMELLFVHEGSGRAIVGQKIIEVTSGTLIMFPPFQLHRLQMEVKEDAAYIRSYVLFEPNALDPYLLPFPSLRSFFHQLWKGADEVRTIHEASLTPLLEQLIDRLGYSERGDEAADPVSRGERFAVFLLTVLQWIQALWQDHDQGGDASRNPSTWQAVPHAEHILQWLELHYKEPFRMEDLAREVHLSPKYISALFSKWIGSSITNYIISRRIREACMLLRKSPLPIQDIAQEIGLTSSSYFCQLFKRNVGISPHQYRRQVPH